MPKYCDEPYGELVIDITKVLSAWTEVWVSICFLKLTKSSIFLFRFFFATERSAALTGRNDD